MAIFPLAPDQTIAQMWSAFMQYAEEMDQALGLYCWISSYSRVYHSARHIMGHFEDYIS